MSLTEVNASSARSSSIRSNVIRGGMKSNEQEFAILCTVGNNTNDFFQSVHSGKMVDIQTAVLMRYGELEERTRQDLSTAAREAARTVPQSAVLEIDQATVDRHLRDWREAEPTGKGKHNAMTKLKHAIHKAAYDALKDHLHTVLDKVTGQYGTPHLTKRYQAANNLPSWKAKGKYVTLWNETLDTKVEADQVSIIRSGSQFSSSDADLGAPTQYQAEIEAGIIRADPEEQVQDSMETTSETSADGKEILIAHKPPMVSGTLPDSLADVKAVSVKILDVTGRYVSSPPSLGPHVAFRCSVDHHFSDTNLLESGTKVRVRSAAYMRHDPSTGLASSTFASAARSVAADRVPRHTVLKFEEDEIKNLLEGLNNPNADSDQRIYARAKIKRAIELAAYRSISPELHDAIIKGAEASRVSSVLVRHITTASNLRQWLRQKTSQYATDTLWDDYATPKEDSLTHSEVVQDLTGRAGLREQVQDKPQTDRADFQKQVQGDTETDDMCEKFPDRQDLMDESEKQVHARAQNDSEDSEMQEQDETEMTETNGMCEEYPDERNFIDDLGIMLGSVTDEPYAAQATQYAYIDPDLWRL